MAIEVKLPRLGESMEEATIISCQVAEGDEVSKGDQLFMIETDKAAMDVESPADGFVKLILPEVGQTLPVGQTIMVLGRHDEKVPTSLIEQLKNEFCTVETATAESSVYEPLVLPEQADALAETAVPLPAVGLADTVPLSKMQRITGQKMVQSKRDIPAFYLTIKVDITELVEIREKLNSGGKAKISYNVMLIKAVAAALPAFPLMTGLLDGDQIHMLLKPGIGLAIDTPAGLVAPVVKGPIDKGLGEIASDVESLAEKAHAGELSVDDLQGGCITISNLGAMNIESFVPIVIPGQCSIMGVGRIADTLFPDNSGFAVRKTIKLTLAIDHRIANGAYAAQFLDHLKNILQDPKILAK